MLHRSRGLALSKVVAGAEKALLCRVVGTPLEAGRGWWVLGSGMVWGPEAQLVDMVEPVYSGVRRQLQRGGFHLQTKRFQGVIHGTL